MRTVVLYGTSLHLSSIGTMFENRPEWRVVRVDPGRDNAAQLERLRPQVVVLDLGLVQRDLMAVCRARRDVLLVGVDLAMQQAVLLTPHASSAVTTSDLLRLVELRNAPATVVRTRSNSGRDAIPHGERAGDATRKRWRHETRK